LSASFFSLISTKRNSQKKKKMDADAVRRLADPQLALLGGRAYRTNLPPGAIIESLVRGQSEPPRRSAASSAGKHAKRDGGDTRRRTTTTTAATSRSSHTAATTEEAAGAAAASVTPALLALETPQTLPEGVETDAAGKLVFKLPVQPRFFGAIIGRSGATLRSLQERTGAAVTVPAKQSKDAFVTLRAETLEKLDAARLEVDLLVADAIERSPPTHFVSLPLATSPEVAATVKTFLDDTCAGTPVCIKGWGEEMEERY
jgi:hypothetical protein